jgi:hypothetical protein
MKDSIIMYTVFLLFLTLISFAVFAEYGFGVLMSLFGFILTGMAWTSYYLLPQEYHYVKFYVGAASAFFWLFLLMDVLLNAQIEQNPTPLALFLLSSYVLWLVSAGGKPGTPWTIKN